MSEPGDRNERAEMLARSLTQNFAGLRRGRLRNTAPLRLRQFGAFNYWWLAHAVEARVDAFERSGDPTWLRLAGDTYAGIRSRNRGSLFNDYFDDMSWLAIAALRLFDASGDGRYLDDARALWQHIVSAGFTTTEGASIAWRTGQPGYKNAPTNGAFGIVSARLFARTAEHGYDVFAQSSLAWLDERLVDPATAFVSDGVNRLGDGRVDHDWSFSYTQGLYIGALVEAFRRDGDRAHLDRARQCAATAIARLAPSGVIAGETADLRHRRGGDAGLFKGIFFRYLGELALCPRPQAEAEASPAETPEAAFIGSNADTLWAHLSPTLLAADTHTERPGSTTYLSTQISAVLLFETAARLDRQGRLGRATL